MRLARGGIAAGCIAIGVMSTQSGVTVMARHLKHLDNKIKVEALM